MDNEDIGAKKANMTTNDSNSGEKKTGECEKRVGAGDVNGALLAYLGDAQLELCVRRRLVTSGGKLGALNAKADGMVSAKAQCRALEILMPLFTEEEKSAYNRGKNIHTNNIPKSVSALQYRKATGLEAVFGYLCIIGDTGRIEYLVGVGFFGEQHQSG